MNTLREKIAVITGGTSGIGAATAKLFQAEGATVIATGTSEGNVEKARREMPGIDSLCPTQAMWGLLKRWCNM